MKETKKISIETEEIISMTCDRCNFKKTKEGNLMGFQEFVSIRFNCGYGSVFNDGDTMLCELCDSCAKNLLGKYLRRQADDCDTRFL